MNAINLNELPKTIQQQVKEQLTAFTRAYVTRENGEYTFTACLSLDTRVKAPDFKTFEFKNTDLYSPAQISEFNRSLPDMSW